MFIVLNVKITHFYNKCNLYVFRQKIHVLNLKFGFDFNDMSNARHL